MDPVIDVVGGDDFVIVKLRESLTPIEKADLEFIYYLAEHGRYNFYSSNERFLQQYVADLLI